MNELELAVIKRVKFVVGKKDVRPESALVDDLLVDSLAFIRLVVDLETHFDMMFEDEDMVIEQFPTVNDLFRYIADKSVTDSRSAL